MNNTTTRLAFVSTFLFVGLLTSSRLDAQNAWWTWASGTGVPNTTPNWGQKGTYASTNEPGGRIGCSGWMDPSGNYWIYGGETPQEGLYADLWEYVSGKGWTWMSGANNNNSNPGVYGTEYTAGPNNMPGGRWGQSGFIDNAGNFWIFGGYGYDANGNLGILNDLWEYTNGQWTWMGGDNIANQPGSYGETTGQGTVLKPGARSFASGWADAKGNIWIFGGNGNSWNTAESGTLNDLWEYSPISHQWTWIGGSYGTNQQGSYGTRKVTNGTSNYPGARFGQQVIVDALGNFWLFGGVSTAAAFSYPAGTSANSYLNDLWEYSPTTGYWTWISGSSSTNQDGTYGTMGVMAKGNAPGARFLGAFQIDINGNFWVYGGYGLNNSPGGFSPMNDLWTYNPVVDAWAWVNGPQAGTTPTYGQKGVAALGNEPPGMQGFASWLDREDNLWIMGGGTGGSPNLSGGDPNLFYDNLWFTPTPYITLALQDVTLQGVPQGQGNLLTWQTINEINTANFQVQRSTDGANYSGVGTVAAVGSGNNSYSFDDATLPANINTFYYRLKIADRDSTYSWSTTIVVRDGGTSATGLTLYPNPARSQTVLQIGANSSLLNTPARLLDASGRTVKEYLITSGQQLIDLTNIPQGAYFLQLTNGTTLKLVKD
jgi:hypothetical protein